MIFDKISNLDFYVSFDSRFALISDFIKKTNIDALEPGRYELGEGIFANVSEYEPYKTEICWEAHRKYADLQYLYSGDEIIEWAPMDELTEAGEYSEEDDFQGTMKTGVTKLSLTVNAGSFAYFAPCDLHRPGLFRNAEKVKKIVFKIPVIPAEND